MLSLHILCEFHPTWCNIHEEVHILWCTFCRKLIYHIYTNVRQFISIFIIWKWGHLVIAHKLKHILCSYFPEIGRLWRAVLLYAELSLYLGSCNYVLFLTFLNCLCCSMCVCQLKPCVVMEIYLAFQIFCKTCAAFTFVIHVTVYCHIKCRKIVPRPPILR